MMQFSIILEDIAEYIVNSSFIYLNINHSELRLSVVVLYNTGSEKYSLKCILIFFLRLYLGLGECNKGIFDIILKIIL